MLNINRRYISLAFYYNQTLSQKIVLNDFGHQLVLPEFLKLRIILICLDSCQIRNRDVNKLLKNEMTFVRLNQKTRIKLVGLGVLIDFVRCRFKNEVNNLNQPIYFQSKTQKYLKKFQYLFDKLKYEFLQGINQNKYQKLIKCRCSVQHTHYGNFTYLPIAYQI